MNEMVSTHADIVFQLDTSRRIQTNIFQGLAYNIVRLAFALLRGLDSSSLVDIAFVVHVQLAESIRQAKDVALLQLRIFPASS